MNYFSNEGCIDINDIKMVGYSEEVYMNCTDNKTKYLYSFGYGHFLKFTYFYNKMKPKWCLYIETSPYKKEFVLCESGSFNDAIIEIAGYFGIHQYKIIEDISEEKLKEDFFNRRITMKKKYEIRVTKINFNPKETASCEWTIFDQDDNLISGPYHLYEDAEAIVKEMEVEKECME